MGETQIGMADWRDRGGDFQGKGFLAMQGQAYGGIAVFVDCFARLPICDLLL